MVTIWGARHLALLTLVATLNGIDKHLVPALAEPIKLEFGLSDTQFGFIAGFVYTFGFAVGGVPLTLMIDRMSRTRLLSVLLAIWSLATAVCAFVGSYIQLAVSRFVVGLAEVGGQPISLAIIADWFHIRNRGTALGIWTISRSISLMVSFSVGGYIALHWGWRTAFLLAGVPGLLLAIVILLTLRELPRKTPVEAHSAKSVTRDIFKVFVNNRPLLLLAIGIILVVGCQNGIMAFLSAYLTRIHGEPIDNAGLVGGIILGGGAGIGMPLGGLLTDILGKQSVARQFAVLAGLMFASIPAALIGLLALTVAVAAPALFLFELFASCAYTAGLSAYLNAVPSHRRGSMTSLLTMLVIFVGAGMGPPLAGSASDSFAMIGADEPLRWGLVAITTLMAIAGIMVMIGRSRLLRRG